MGVWKSLLQCLGNLDQQGLAHLNPSGLSHLEINVYRCFFFGFSINLSRKCFSKGQCFLFFVVQQFLGPWFMFAKSHDIKVPITICHPGNTATRGFFFQPRHEMRHNFSKSWRLVHVCLGCLLWKNQDILTKTGRVGTYQACAQNVELPVVPHEAVPEVSKR